MKKTLWSSVVLLLLAVPLAAEVPSMRGYWYNRDTAEMFVIDTDADGTVKGTGVYYAKGKGKFKQLQIMSQQVKGTDETGKSYMLKAYDPATPRAAWELSSAFAPGGILLSVSITGKRNNPAVFANLKDVFPAYEVSTAHLKGVSCDVLFRDALFELRFFLGEDTDLLTFVLQEGRGTVSYKGKEAEVKIDPATHRISFNLPPFGNVRARIGRAMNWQLEILDAKNAPKHTLDQMTD